MYIMQATFNGGDILSWAEKRRRMIMNVWREWKRN